MKHAGAIAEAVAARLNAAAIFNETVVVDTFSRWIENETADFPPTIQLVSVKRDKVDRNATIIYYSFLIRRATMAFDLSANNLDEIENVFANDKYINVNDLGVVRFDSFIFNSPTRTTTNGVSLQGAFDSAVLENDGYFLQTGLLNVYRIEGE